MMRQSHRDTSTTEYLVGVVEKYLAVSLYDTARFYAERMICYCNSGQSDDDRKDSYFTCIYLLALCYYRMGKFQQAYLILLDHCTTTITTYSSGSSAYKYTINDSKYLFALACFKLNKLAESERVLLSASILDGKDSRNLTLRASCLHLLGKICRRQQRREISIEYFMQSLQVLCQI